MCEKHGTITSMCEKYDTMNIANTNMPCRQHAKPVTACEQRFSHQVTLQLAVQTAGCTGCRSYRPLKRMHSTDLHNGWLQALLLL